MSESAHTHRLQIAHHWDGRPVSEAEAVDLALSVVGRHLVVEVEGRLHADPAPPARPPGPTPRLWEHEVVEIFIADAGARYLEIELGPWGHHLVLRLDGVRRVVEEGLPLAFSAVHLGGTPARWRGQASVPLDLLPAAPARFNAYSIHGVGAGRRYLAHAPVPGDRPDFHQLDRFVPWPFAGR